MRRARWTAGASALLAASALASGCHLVSGLADLSIDEKATGTGGEGGAGAGGTGATGGTGGTGGDTGGGGSGGTTTSSGPMCMDGSKNGTETDSDCGGPDCEQRCAEGRSCLVSSDCESGVCRDTTCRGVKAIAAGSAHACAVLTTDELYCWGDNTSGQLGVGDTVVDQKMAYPVTVPGGVAAITAGGAPEDRTNAHTCALSLAGEVYCWGSNSAGQLGIGTGDLSTKEPALVQLPLTATAIAAGGAFTCAILSDTKVWCWGADGLGQLGTGGVGTGSDVPVQVGGAGNATAISAGAAHACVVGSDASAVCWGDNESGQVGNDAAAKPATPIAATMIAGVTSVRAGHAATCARDATGFWCWGDNADQQLTGKIDVETATPTKLDLADVVTFDLGSDGDTSDANEPAGGHGCAVSPALTVQCWGNNRKGQLGRDPMDADISPKLVDGLANIASVSLGAQFSCALGTKNGVHCWGHNDVGQLGAPTAGETHFQPVRVVWP